MNYFFNHFIELINVNEFIHKNLNQKQQKINAISYSINQLKNFYLENSNGLIAIYLILWIGTTYLDNIDIIEEVQKNTFFEFSTVLQAIMNENFFSIIEEIEDPISRFTIIFKKNVFLQKYFNLRMNALKITGAYRAYRFRRSISIRIALKTHLPSDIINKIISINYNIPDLNQ